MDDSPCVVVSPSGVRVLHIIGRALAKQVIVGITRYSRASGDELISFGHRRLSQPTPAELLHINTNVLRTRCIEALQNGSASTVRDVAKVLGLALPKPPPMTTSGIFFSLDGLGAYESLVSADYIRCSLEVPDDRDMPKPRAGCTLDGVLIGQVTNVSFGREIIVHLLPDYFERLKEAQIL